MKKILIAACALMTTMVASADMDDLRVTFETTGPDVYMDGSTVLDGEYYALVWLKDGAEFGGFNADATLIDNANNELVVTVPFAEGGRCPFSYKQIDKALLARYATGSFIVVLLDTRDASGKALQGSRVDGNGVKVPATVNGYSTVTEVSGYAALYGRQIALDVPVNVTTVSGLALDTVRPVITDIKVREGKNGREAVLKVKCTKSYLHYVAAGSDTLADGEFDKIEESAANGAADESQEIEIVVPADKVSNFYQIMRKE